MNDNALFELPKSWKWVSWETILDYENGGFRRGPFGSTLKKSIFVESGYKVYEQYCPINNDCSFGRYYITPEKFEELKSFEVRAGDYLVSCSGSLGRITRVPQEFERGIINQALLRVRINDHIISHLYFLHLFRSPFFQKLLVDNSTGTAITNVKGVKELKAIPIPLPPLAEQSRIVMKIEELFTRLDAGVSELKKTQAQMKRYRQSVLKAACLGKLVPTEAELAKAQGRAYESADVLLARILKERREKWNGKGKYKEPATPDTSMLPKLPEGWMWVTSRTLSWFVTSGSRDWKKYYSNSGAIFIRTQDINKNELSLDNVAFVALPEKVEGKRSIVQKNDILIIITGANVGKVALVERDMDEAYVSQSVALMKLVLPDMAKYIHFGLIADGFGKTELDKMVYGMGRPVLSLENVQDIILPLPPLTEQNRIVAEVERRLSIADGVEKTVVKSFIQAKRLRQSILKKAFEGRLVAQDASDEPADVLLGRIQAEKIRTGNGTKKSRQIKLSIKDVA